MAKLQKQGSCCRLLSCIPPVRNILIFFLTAYLTGLCDCWAGGMQFPQPPLVITVLSAVVWLGYWLRSRLWQLWTKLVRDSEELVVQTVLMRRSNEHITGHLLTVASPVLFHLTSWQAPVRFHWSTCRHTQPISCDWPGSGHFPWRTPPPDIPLPNDQTKDTKLKINWRIPPSNLQFDISVALASFFTFT